MRANYKTLTGYGFDRVVNVSFKSKYITVAILAALLVSLAVGAVMVYENRSQHVALLNSAAADARDRVLGELTLRAADTALHVSERVCESMLRGDRAAIANALESFKRGDTFMGVVLRDVAGSPVYAWRRPRDGADTITRSTVAPVRANVQAM